MRILLLGAGGQLGRALAPALAAHAVVACDHARLDIADLAAVREAVRAAGPDALINAAAFNEVDRAESEPEPAYRGNALGPRNLALASAERGISILHVSTDYVFDGTATTPYHEYHRPHPLSVYGATKLAGEAAVQALNPRHYLVRTAWLYSEVGHNFPRTMLELAATQPVVRVVSDQTGSPTYAPHLAAAIARLIETQAYGIYHLAGRGGTTWFDLTRALYRSLAIDVTVEPVSTAEFPRPAARPRYSVLTTIQEPRLLLPPWEEGLGEFERATRHGGKPARV
jgi:dTDP-4-dehydrorhamnose reductase